MQGFPPPPDKLITQPDSNYLSFPKLRWTVCHLREFLPTEQVSRGIGAPVPLGYDLDESAIDALTFKPLGSEEEMTWKASLSANYTDGVKQAFAKAGYTALAGGSYRSMWWLFHDENQKFAARGVHGQTIYLDPTADMVIVRLASFPTARNAKIDPTSLPAYRAVAEYLMSKPS